MKSTATKEWIFMCGGLFLVWAAAPVLVKLYTDGWLATLVVGLISGMYTYFGWWYIFAARAEDLEPYYSDFKKEISDLFEKYPQKQGLAIIVTMSSSPNGVLGADVDEKNMVESFTALKFAVLKKSNLSSHQFRALIKAAAKFSYPVMEEPSFRVIAFYYAGHGGADSKMKPYVLANDSIELNVEDNIVSPFEPVNAQHLKDIYRLFFFDTCQGSQEDKGFRFLTRKKPPVLKYPLPAKGHCLIAFSGSLNYKVHGDEVDGGCWTMHLSKNIKENEDIHVVLAKTWQETVRLTSKKTGNSNKIVLQGPSMSSCMGPLNLRCINKLGIEDRFEGQDTTSRHTLPGSSLSRENRMSHEEIDHAAEPSDISHLLLKEPQLSHLSSWLKMMKNDWEELGSQLKIPYYELQSIELTKQRQGERLLEVFNKWRNNVPTPYTFQNLLDCLRRMGQNENSPSIRTIYENLKQHQKEYQDKPDYVDYMKKK